MELGHILDSNQTQKQLNEIIKETQKIKCLYTLGKTVDKNYLRGALRNKTVVLLFYQPSTRTRTRFELAAKRLGADIIIINEISHTSVVKGESWRNTIKTLANLGADAIVIRHPKELMPHMAAEVCDKYGFKTKIINAGDGSNFHPTQAILDIFTIKEHFGERFGRDLLNIAIGADITNARVAHSLIAALAQYPVALFLVSKFDPWLPIKYLDPLFNNWIDFYRVEKLPAIAQLDVIYWFRYQIEHGKEELRQIYNQEYGISPAILNRYLKPDGLFIHPGPRDGEIDDSIDQDPRVKDGQQVQNGVFISMALLKMILNPAFYIPPRSLKLNF